MRLYIYISFAIIFFSLSITKASNFNLDDGFSANVKKYNKALINSIDTAGERLIGVGVHGIIIFSDDSGKNWEQSSVPTTLTLTDIDCISENICWAVGHDAIILKTEDRGENWIKQYSDEVFDAPLLSIAMFDKNSGIAVGAFAKSLKTNDAGATWIDFYINEDEFQPHINSIITNKDRAYATGELGLFYVSNDKGDTWEQYETGYNGSLWAALITTDDKVMLAGMSGNFILSTKNIDGAYEFKINNNGSRNTLTNLINLNNGDIAISGLGGVISIIDFNESSVSTCVRQDRLGNTGLFEINENELLVIGQRRSRVHNMQECYLSSLELTSVNTWLKKDIN